MGSIERACSYAELAANFVPSSQRLSNDSARREIDTNLVIKLQFRKYNCNVEIIRDPFRHTFAEGVIVYEILQRHQTAPSLPCEN